MGDYLWPAKRGSPVTSEGTLRYRLSSPNTHKCYDLETYTIVHHVDPAVLLSKAV